MPEKYTFDIQHLPNAFKGTCREVPAASGWAESFDGCAVNLAEAVETALRENEEFLALKTFTLETKTPGGMRALKMRLIHSPEGFSIGCLDLPGCWSQGTSEEEAVENIREAIVDYLEVAEERTKEREGHLGKVA